MTGIHPTAIVETDRLGTDVSIGAYVVIASDVELGDGVEVMPGAFIGREPKAAGAVARAPQFDRGVRVGAGSLVGPGAVIYHDTELGEGCLVGDGASIRERCRIAERCVIGRMVTVDRGVRMGAGTRVMDKAHLTGEMSIGRDVFISAGVVSTNDNTFAAAGAEDALRPPRIEDEASIGALASLLPGVVIGHQAVVGSGAVVTRDVERGTTVFGIPARPREAG